MTPATIQVCFLFFVSIVNAVPINPRLSLADEWNSYYKWEHQGPGTYAFGYDIEDPTNNNIQFRHEEKHPNGTVTGSYGLVDATGVPVITHYISDDLGYRVRIEDNLRGIQDFPPLNMPLQPNQEINNINYETVTQSPQFVSAVDSLNTLGQNVYEQHSPPKYLNGQYYNNYNNKYEQGNGYFNYFK